MPLTGAFGIGSDPDDAVVFHVQIKLAANSTIGAGCGHQPLWVASAHCTFCCPMRRSDSKQRRHRRTRSAQRLSRYRRQKQCGSGCRVPPGSTPSALECHRRRECSGCIEYIYSYPQTKMDSDRCPPHSGGVLPLAADFNPIMPRPMQQLIVLFRILDSHHQNNRRAAGIAPLCARA